MRAAWYQRQGPARDVLVVGEMDAPDPGPGEVRIRVGASGINPGDVKKRIDAFGVGMPYPRIVPHSDGAGTIDQAGEGVPAARVGERVWCHGAQSYRPFGTAAEYVVVAAAQALPLADGIAFERGACLGIPGITAHRAVHIGGSVRDRTVLVQGGGGAVGQCAVALARHAGAHVIATARSARDAASALRAGAHEAIRTDGLPIPEAAERIRRAAPRGVQHVVEVALDANIALDEAVLAQAGSIAAYATGAASQSLPFWPLLFKNARLFFIGSDDLAADAKAEAARALNATLAGRWPGFENIRILPLAAIAQAHELVEAGGAGGRVVVAP